MNPRTGNRQQGVFLVEALIALAVLAIGLVALVKFESTLASNGAVAKQRTEATLLGQREIEMLRSFVDPTAYDAYFASANPATLERSVDGENASYAITVTLTDENTAVGGRHANVDLKVGWTDQKGVSHEVHLVSSFPRLAVASSGQLLVTPATTPPTTTVCAAGSSQSWTVGGITCSGPITVPGGVGFTEQVQSTINQGVNQYVCQADGSWAEVASYPKSCTAQCPAQTASWTGTAGATCSASLAQASDGATVSVTDATAPVTGSATYACTNGSWSLAASPEATCVATCPAATQTWDTLIYDGSNRCQMPVTQTTAPLTQSADNSVSGVLTATATYTCTNLGTWNKSASTCAFTSTTPGYCRADSISWTVGDVSCTGLRPQTPSGQSYTITITEGSRLGRATYACASGSWSTTPTDVACTNNCFIRLSGSIDSQATYVYVNGVQASCNVSNKTYLCSSLAVTENANVTVQAFKSNGDAAGTAKTLPGQTCGASTTLDLR